MNIKNKPLILTTGDSCGVGVEVTAKSLLQASNAFLRKWPLIIIRKHPDLLSPEERRVHELQMRRLKKRLQVKTLTWSSTASFPDIDFKENRIAEVLSLADAPFWVEWAARECQHRRAGALITAPLSKQLISSCGMVDIGHTDILKRVTKTKNVYMSFLGSDFSVVLLTGHIPLGQVSQAVRPQELHSLIRLLLSHGFLKKRPAALLGLNPHAGDGGLIGREELTWLNSFAASKKKYLIGPMAPDSAFSKDVWKKISIYIALYHDQGLIPFKLQHGFRGCHFSLGLPIIRTSVDHGTAFDIFSKDKADPSSMLSALSWAGRMAQTEMTKTALL